MRIGMMRVTLMIPGSHSLKEKRRPLKGLMEKVRNRFKVSVAEVDAQDLHQRAVVGVAVAAADGGILGREMQAISEFFHNNPECMVLEIESDSIGWRKE